MRGSRTKLENWAISQLVSLLEADGQEWTEDPEVTDAPDLALQEASTGHRVACEVTTVGLNEWHQWSNDPKYQFDVDELDEIVCPREPDYWLKMVLAAKNPKIARYLANANASEAWLLVHGDMHDFFVLDDDYDIPAMQATATAEQHEFSHIYIASPQNKSRPIAQVFPTLESRANPPHLSYRANIKAMQIRSM